MEVLWRQNQHAGHRERHETRGRPPTGIVEHHRALWREPMKRVKLLLVTPLRRRNGELTASPSYPRPTRGEPAARR
jgi:hypothetical protein